MHKKLIKYYMKQSFNAILKSPLSMDYDVHKTDKITITFTQIILFIYVRGFICL